jgi:hypothetical protein
MAAVVLTFGQAPMTSRRKAASLDPKSAELFDRLLKFARNNDALGKQSQSHSGGSRGCRSAIARQDAE